jgi:hypothetical protein
MATETETTQTETDDTTGNPSAASATPAATTPATPAAPAGNRNVVHMTSTALKERLDAAKDKGGKALRAELDKQAQELGYKDHASLVADAVERKKNPTPPATQAKPGEGKGYVRKLEQERDGLKAKFDQEFALRKKFERENRELRRRLDATEARTELEKAALSAGIAGKDVSYAVNLLTQAQEGKTEDELKGFDESKFFQELRAERPYLFGEVTRPATTGTGTPATPAAPTPAATQRNTSEAAQVDARKMSRQEYLDHLAKMGLSSSGVTVVEKHN